MKFDWDSFILWVQQTNIILYFNLNEMKTHMKMTAFCDTATFSLVEAGLRYRDAASTIFAWMV